VHAARRATEVIAALPTRGWPVHLTHVVALTGLAPDIALSGVFDAARARTENARVRARMVLPGRLLEPAVDAGVAPSVPGMSAAETGPETLADSVQAAQRGASAGQYPRLPARPRPRQGL
jgi:hypothetical protein